ncbi:DUF6168 family protein [Formosa haliotis]|uniref:DUF6168 family protein n=1 Tax=Formosa haliotis TaxID=1555194 RepID=UPI000823FB3F|nr:DUF6168 family protein [Formosa haliotis]
MKQQLRSFLMVLVPLTLLLYVLQTLLVGKLQQSYDFQLPTWGIYVFHFFATLAVYSFVAYVNSVFSDKTGFAFMACGLLKMFAAVIFLLPLILNAVETPVSDVLAFFIPYFIFLLLETVFVIRLLAPKP